MNNINYNELFELGDRAIGYVKTRSYNYGVYAWGEMLNNWCARNNTTLQKIPVVVKDQLKKQHLLFCDFFNET